MWLWSKAAAVRDLNTGHGVRNSTAQAQGESSLKGCKISYMASLKEVCSQEPQEEATCCNGTLSHLQKDALRPALLPPVDSYRAISWISSICSFPYSPKTLPGLKTYHTQEEATSWLLVWQADARKHPGPMPWVGRRELFWFNTIPLPAHQRRNSLYLRGKPICHFSHPSTAAEHFPRQCLLL